MIVSISLQTSKGVVMEKLKHLLKRIDPSSDQFFKRTLLVVGALMVAIGYWGGYNQGREYLIVWGAGIFIFGLCGEKSK